MLNFIIYTTSTNECLSYDATGYAHGLTLHDLTLHRKQTPLQPNHIDNDWNVIRIGFRACNPHILLDIVSIPSLSCLVVTFFGNGATYGYMIIYH